MIIRLMLVTCGANTSRRSYQ